jgi:flagellin
MSLGVLNNISAIYAQNNLNSTQSSLQKVLTQLSSGSRINSGADDAAGLSLADGLAGNQAALSQSAQNASQGVGFLQTADGALSQVNNLLNRAVTLATEASNGTLTGAQSTAADQEFQSIMDEIGNIGSTTTYNGNAVFGSASGVAIYTGDGTTAGSFTDTLTVASLSASSVGDAGGTLTYTAATSSAGASLSYAAGASGSVDFSSADLTNNTNAQAALALVNTAIADVAGQRGYIGAQINTLNAVSNVETTEKENLAAAENSVTATDYSQATSDMSKYEILSQTGISALAQANSVEQEVTKLLQ